MNEVVKFITSLVTFLQGMWVYFDNKITSISQSLTTDIATAKGEAIVEAEAKDYVLRETLELYADDKASEALTAAQNFTTAAKDELVGDISDLTTSLTQSIATAKQEAITDANSAITSNNLTITSAYETDDANTLQASKDYTDLQIQDVSKDVQSAVSLIQQVQVLAANGMIGSIVNLGTNASAVLGLIEAAIPEVNGDMVDGNYGIVLSLRNGTDSLTFTRGVDTFTVSSGDFVQIKVAGGEIDTFVVAHDNDNIRIGDLEVNKAAITYVDSKDLATNERIDSFKSNLNTVMLQAFTGNADALAIWQSSFVA